MFDINLVGRTALVCGASKGLGRACAEALAAAGANLVINARTSPALEEARRLIAEENGIEVRRIVADVTTEAGRETLLAACPNPDILVTNSAGPPARRFEDLGRAEWQAACDANMIAPILLIGNYLAGMRHRRWGRVINITSSSVKAPLPLLSLSNGVRAGLTGFVAGISREVAADGVTINNLLPGYFGTARLSNYFKALAEARGVTEETIRREVEEANPSKRLGRPPELGALCAFLSSEHAGYITGQNLLIDGGAYPGML